MQLAYKHSNIQQSCSKRNTCKIKQKTAKRKEIDTTCTTRLCVAYNIPIVWLQRTWSMDQEQGIKKLTQLEIYCVELKLKGLIIYIFMEVA